MKDKKSDIPLWLKYGIKEISFHNKYKKNYDELRCYYIENIINSNKVIPSIDLMKKSGEWYGRRDLNTSGFDGFDLSYFIVSYLIHNNYNIENLISNSHELEMLEPNLIQNTINYYNNYFKVSEIKNNFNDVTTARELMDFMNKEMVYGWLDKENKKHFENLKQIKENYKTKSIDVILKSKVGNCIDQAKLQKAFFDSKNIENKLYCFLYKEKMSETIKIHPITIYKENNKWYHFEHAFYKYKGIHEFNNINDLLYSFKTVCFSNSELINIKEIYDIPENITISEFIEYIENQNINDKRI